MRKRLLFFMTFLIIGIGLVTAQNARSITGIVLSSEDNQPIVGASVVIKGTSAGTITNIDGEFTLSVPHNAKQLQVSYIGMKSQVVNIKPGKLRIILDPDTEVLDEVVVTGMQRMDKRLLQVPQLKSMQKRIKWMVLPISVVH